MNKLKRMEFIFTLMHQPLGEFDPAYMPFVESLRKMILNLYLLACSGHAHPNDLIKIIDLLNQSY